MGLHQSSHPSSRRRRFQRRRRRKFCLLFHFYPTSLRNDFITGHNIVEIFWSWFYWWRFWTKIQLRNIQHNWSQWLFTSSLQAWKLNICCSLFMKEIINIFIIVIFVTIIINVIIIYRVYIFYGANKTDNILLYNLAILWY